MHDSAELTIRSGRRLPRLGQNVRDYDWIWFELQGENRIGNDIGVIINRLDGDIVTMNTFIISGRRTTLSIQIANTTALSSVDKIVTMMTLSFYWQFIQTNIVH